MSRDGKSERINLLGTRSKFCKRALEMNEYNNSPSHLYFETKPYLGLLCERHKAVQTLQIDQGRPPFSSSVFLRNISSCGCLHKAQCSCWISRTNECTSPLPFSLPNHFSSHKPRVRRAFLLIWTAWRKQSI